MKSTNAKTMSYDIFSSKAPKMPTVGNGTEFVKLVLSQATKSMQQPLLPMALPAVAAHLCDVEFMYSDNKYYEMCGQMGHLIGNSGVGKAQLTHLIEAIMRDFRVHDEAEYNKLVEWQRRSKTAKANERKPDRPDVALWFPPADVTNAAFLQNAMALEKDGNRTQYINLPEVEMADRMCGGRRQVSQAVRNIYDRERAGALRATIEGVTGNPILRANITFSSTPDAARAFYKRDLTNGFFGRIPFAYKAREPRSGRIPRQGTYSKDFLEQLDRYLRRVDGCKGQFFVKELNKVADNLAEEMAAVADLADDDMLFELSHRSIFAAWKKGAVLWVLNEQVWTRSIGEFVKWFCYYDLWSKVQVFGDMFHKEDESESDGRRGPRNMLEGLDETFSETQLQALRESLGKSAQGAHHQLEVWVSRGLVVFNPETALYTKTMGYLDGSLRKRSKK